MGPGCRSFEKTSGTNSLIYGGPARAPLRDLGKAIQGLIIFSAVLGALFLWEARPLLPASVFDFILVGWALFVLDAGLTFVKPVPAYYLGLVLAVLTLASSLPQPAHYAFLQDGQYLAAATFLAGTAAQFVLIPSVLYYAVSSRRASRGAGPATQT